MKNEYALGIPIEIQPKRRSRFLEKNMALTAINIASIAALSILVPKVVDGVTNGHETVDNAQSTIELYDNTDIALVAYGMEQDDVLELATQIETNFEETTDGIISIDIDIVELSKAAISHYESRNDEACVKSSSFGNFGSLIADSNMPSLKQYDKIIALNAYPDCASDEIKNGVAIMNGRYAEVFNTEHNWEIIKENGGSQEVVSMLGEHSISVSLLYTPVNTGVHEILHMYGLGHSGNFETKAEYRGDESNLTVWSEGKLEKVINFKEFIASKNFAEYGGYGVMGSGSLPNANKLNVIERYALEWPQRRLGEQTTTEQFTVKQKAVEFTDFSNKDTFASFELPEPVNVDDEHSFTRFVFVPIGDEFGKNLRGVQAYLVNDDNDQGYLGALYNANMQDTMFTFEFDNEALNIELSYSNNQVTLQRTEGKLTK